jgi:protein gp37
MADKSAIEWTEATWNPVTGCSKVSPGCDHCYAETLSLRFGHSKKPWTPENAAENVVLHPERLDQPLKWKRPRMIFVNSMSDLFHENIPDEYVMRVFTVMRRASQHQFQILTKRPRRALDLLSRLSWKVGDYGFDAYLGEPGSKPITNVWLGVSIESWRYNWRADVLRRVPAAVRFISAEPLLDTLYPEEREERWLNLDGIDWLIVGGESGIGHRPMYVEWVRELQANAHHAGTAFFFKQWGGRTPKAGGRELDGREWNEMPGAQVLA